MAILMESPVDAPHRSQVRDIDGRIVDVVALRRPRFYNARVVEVPTDAQAKSMERYFWKRYDGPIDESIPYALVEGDEVDYVSAFMRIAENIPVEVLQRAIDERDSQSQEKESEVEALDIPDTVDPDNYSRADLLTVLHEVVPDIAGNGYTKSQLVERIRQAREEEGRTLTPGWIEDILERG